MKLTLSLPTETLIKREIAKIVAEAPNGFFCLLPRHIDFATAIVPGILSFETPDGEERLVAVDEGILLKQGPEVFVSTRNAIMGEALGNLEELVNREFEERNEREKNALKAINRLEAGFVRRFVDIQHGE